MDNLLILLVPVNLLSFALFFVDKEKAKNGSWRISEKALLTSAILFGAPGAWIGMKCFHHKTRKPLFAIGVPVLCVLEIGLLAYALLK